MKSATQRFKLGDVVECQAAVLTSYMAPDRANAAGWELVHTPKGGPQSGYKYMYRIRCDVPVIGVIIGYTYRDTGKYRSADYYAEDSDPPYLEVDKRHRVWMVATTLRWRQPWLVLEDDLRLLSEEAMGGDLEPVIEEEGE